MKTICLCLPENHEKIAAAREHFELSGLKDVEFFFGIHAEKAGLSTIHTYEVDNPGSGFRVGYKITGTWLGHWMLWNYAMRLPDDIFLFLEDDAKFHENWQPRFAQAMRDVPNDFDILSIGHCCLKGHPATLVRGEVYETKHAQCTHASVISKKCLDFLVGTIRKCWAPIDCQLIFEAYPYLRTFAVIPRMVDQFDTELAP
jgi:GR25 family glycosyltransferase involved in LPS biosynthesis